LAEEGELIKELGDHDGKPATSFLDLGTGNGHLLFALRDAGWCGEMLGVDYSAASLKLARQIGENRASQNPTTQETDEEDQGEEEQVEVKHIPVYFQEYDIFAPKPLQHAPPTGFDIVLDKGTFDAISLSSEVDSSGRRLCESYCSHIKPLIREGGLFVITSCNWTEEELRAWFESGEGVGELSFHDRIKYPRFTFGGKTGQSVVTLCFQNGEDRRL
jgi:SAM-dependent methyltransferase